MNSGIGGTSDNIFKDELFPIKRQGRRKIRTTDSSLELFNNYSETFNITGNFKMMEEM